MLGRLASALPHPDLAAHLLRRSQMPVHEIEGLVTRARSIPKRRRGQRQRIIPVVLDRLGDVVDLQRDAAHNVLVGDPGGTAARRLSVGSRTTLATRVGAVAEPEPRQ